MQKVRLSVLIPWVCILAFCLFFWYGTFNLVFGATSESTSIAQQSQGQNQIQYQGQGQSQSQVFNPTQSQSLSTTNSVDYNPSVANTVQVEKTDPVISNSFNSKSNVQRPLPYLDAPTISTNGGPAAFWQPTGPPGPRFVSASILTQILNAVDIDNATPIHPEDIDIETQVLATGLKKTGQIKFSVANSKQKYSNNPLAVITIQAGSKEVNSATLALLLAKKAREVGGTRIIFVSEGEIIQLETKGWGLGFNQSAAYTGSSGGSMGGVSAGGTGYSSGWARYVKFPWITAIILE